MFVLEHGIMNMQSPIALFNAKLAKTANHSATASADSLVAHICKQLLNVRQRAFYLFTHFA
jgi:hypothetical protein